MQQIITIGFILKLLVGEETCCVSFPSSNELRGIGFS